MPNDPFETEALTFLDALYRTALRMTREWAALHVAELEANWQRAKGEDPLEPIPPLP